MIRDVPLKPGYCSHLVWNHDGWGGRHQCPRKIKVTRESRGYCSLHDPEATARRQAENEARFREELQARQARWERERVTAVVCLDVPTDSLRRLADAGGLAAIWEAVEAAMAGSKLVPKTGGVTQ